MTVTLTVHELPGAHGLDLGVSRGYQVDQSRIDGFADLTEDHQWIHVDPVRAAVSSYGSTIAHGYLTLALVAPVVLELLQVSGHAYAVNYGLDRVRFPRPLRSGSTVRGRGSVRRVEPLEGCTQVVLRIELTADGETAPACVADSVLRFYL